MEVHYYIHCIRIRKGLTAVTVKYNQESIIVGVGNTGWVEFQLCITFSAWVEAWPSQAISYKEVILLLLWTPGITCMCTCHSMINIALVPP